MAARACSFTSHTTPTQAARLGSSFGQDSGQGRKFRGRGGQNAGSEVRDLGEGGEGRGEQWCRRCPFPRGRKSASRAAAERERERESTATASASLRSQGHGYATTHPAIRIRHIRHAVSYADARSAALCARRLGGNVRECAGKRVGVGVRGDLASADGDLEVLGDDALLPDSPPYSPTPRLTPRLPASLPDSPPHPPHPPCARLARYPDRLLR
eukprot:2970694-Rhodomonas_salina.1